MARASYSYALMSLSNQVVIDINQDPLSIIEKDFNGLYSGRASSFTAFGIIVIRKNKWVVRDSNPDPVIKSR